MTPWRFYVVEHAFVVRMDSKAVVAQRLMRDRSWVDYPDIADVTYNGRQLKDEAEALAMAERLFAKYPELP